MLIQLRRGRARTLSKRERELLDLTARAAANTARAGELLCEMFDRWDDRAAIADQIRACEHAGDEITHSVLDGLHRSTVRPVDRGDIHAIASAIDDITDLVEEVADLTGLYHIEAPMDQAIELASIIRLQARGRHDRDHRRQALVTAEQGENQ